MHSETLALSASAPPASDVASGERDAESRLPAGTVVAGRYVVRGEIGRGGFAVVYDAEHTGLARRVALKVVHLYEDMPAELLARARREARNAALVRHPNVLEVFDTGSLEDGSPYLVMERLQGETLTTRIARRDLTLAAIVETGRQLTLALDALAARSLIHRDIKPDNVMLHDRGAGRLILKLVDFGISKRADTALGLGITREGYLVGTPSYMSPEQARGEPLDTRSDIYAVGAVLYAALTGRPPHDRPSVQESILATLHEPVESIRAQRSDCPEELERIVLKALSKSPGDRYASASLMRLELEAFAVANGLPSASKAWPASMSACKAPLARLGGPRMRLALTGILLSLLAAGATSVVRSRAVRAAVVEPVPARVTVPPRPSEPTPPPPTASAPALEPVHAQPRPVLTPPVPSAEPRSVRATRPSRGGGQPTAKDSAPPVAARVPDSSAQETAPVAAPPAERPAQPTVDTQDLVRQALKAYALGESALAERLYREVLEVRPDDPDALRGLGIVSARLGHHAAARAAFQRYLDAAPTAKDAASIRARLSALE